MLIEQNFKNQICYIVEAAVDYFITILISGAFLASLLSKIGVPDSVTGIITAFTSLGFSAQLVAVLFIRPQSNVKRMVSTMNLISHLMFVVLYFTSYMRIAQTVKVAMFAVLLLGGQMVLNAASPFKYTWFMSFVPERNRGRFTADKEIVSLAGGMAFSYVMGAVIDYCKAAGNDDFGFAICGCVIFALSVIHLITVLMVKEDATADNQFAKNYKKHSIRYVFGCTLFDKCFSKIILLDILWHIGTGVSVSFFGTYQINELGFSLRYVAILSVVMSITRVVFSRTFGKMADKIGWARMLMVSMGIGAVGFLINTFTAPSNGKWMFALYYVFYAIYMAGSNSGMTNIVFDYSPEENCSYAIGIKAALGGIFGFVASLFGAWVVNVVQALNNKIFDVTIYAQQLLSFCSFCIFAVAVLYIKLVITKLPKQ